MAESADWDRLVLGETSWTKDLSTARTADAGTIRVKCVSAFGAAPQSGLDRERNLTKQVPPPRGSAVPDRPIGHYPMGTQPNWIEIINLK